MTLLSICLSLESHRRVGHIGTDIVNGLRVTVSINSQRVSCVCESSLGIGGRS